MSLLVTPVKINVAVTDEFVVRDGSATRITGILAGAFTTTLYNNGASSAQTVTITEVASGVYKVTFTPNAVGEWHLLIAHATYGEWEGGYRCENRDTDDLAFPLTSGRGTLTNADGSVAPDWSNVKSPTTVLDLSGTTIKNLDNPPLGAAVIRSGTCQAGSTSTTIVFDAGASATDSIYNRAVVFITGGTGLGQAAQIITAYTGSTKTATVAPGWTTTPDATTTFQIIGIPGAVNVELWRNGIPGTLAAGGNVPASVQAWFNSTPNALIAGRVDANAQVVGDKTGYSLAVAPPTLTAIVNGVWDEARANHIAAGTFGQLGALLMRDGTAQAGTANNITLDAGASATNDFYRRSAIFIYSGTGSGQSPRFCTGYVGSTKVATISPAWTTNPDATSKFIVIAKGQPGVDWANIDNPTVNVDLNGTTIKGLDAGGITSSTFAAGALAAVWDELTSGHVTAGTFGKLLGAILFSAAGNVKADVEEWRAAVPNALVANRVDTNVGSVTAGAIAAAAFAAGALGSVWDELLANHVVASSFGKVFGVNLDANVGSRATPAQILATPANLLATDASGRVTLTPAEETAIAAAVWAAAAAIDGTLTPAQAVTYIFAAVAGVSTGEPAGATDTFKGPAGTVKVTTTYDANNNRTGVTLS